MASPNAHEPASKTLLLLRHAKSSWSEPALADHDRPLADRGRRAAELISRYMEDSGIRPALVLCSPARRAQDTLAIVRTRLGSDVEVRFENGIYSADAEEVLGRLQSVPASIASVMVVGHNPALHDLAVALAGDGDHDALSQLRVKFPTGALASLDLGDAEWAALGPGGAFLSALVLPRQLEP
jgi:phosphohistidine phosphatase